MAYPRLPSFLLIPLCVAALASCATRTTAEAGCSASTDAARRDGGVCPNPATTACGVNGGTTTVTVVRNVEPLAGIAADDHHVYFSVIRYDATSGSVSSYEIDAVALPCGSASRLVTRSGAVQTAEGMVGPVLDNGVLYWIDGGGLLALPVAGGQPTTLIGSRPAPFQTRGFYSPALAVHGGYVYWADVDGTVSRVPVAGGAPDILASGYGSPGAIAVDDANVYWASIEEAPQECRRSRSTLDGGDCGSAATLFRMPVAGGSVSTVATRQAGTDSILSTPMGLYWANYGGFGVDAPTDSGGIMHLASSGGSPVAITTSGAPDMLQLAGGTLYWLEHGAVGWAVIASQHNPNPWDDFTTLPRIRGFVATPKSLYWMAWSDQMLVAVYSSPLP